MYFDPNLKHHKINEKDPYIQVKALTRNHSKNLLKVINKIIYERT